MPIAGVPVLVFGGLTALLFSLSEPIEPEFSITGSCIADVDNGENMTAAAGCVSCHALQNSNPPALGGSVEIASVLGTKATPNISRRLRAGIGERTWIDFLNAVKNGALVYRLRLEGSSMADREVIDLLDQTRRLSIEDYNAIFEYLISIE